MPEDPAAPIVDAFTSAVKLSANDAKTLIYYRAASTKLSGLRFFPAVAMIGPSGSGKSTAERGMKSLHSDSTYSFSCSGITAASARDELAKAYNLVAIVEEFDQLKDQLGTSRFFQARCDRETSSIAFKEPLQNGSYRDKTVELFGGTILHARNNLAEPALVSRTITVHTKHQPPPYSEVLIPQGSFAHLLSQVDWSVQATGMGVNGRLYDTWYPILRVAAGIGDQEWLDYAEIQIKLLQRRLEEAAGYDYRQVILARIVELLSDRDQMSLGNAWTWDRINIGLDIGEHLRKTTLPQLSAWEAADTVKDLGFVTTRRGGRAWLIPSPVTVVLACHENGYEDEWVDDLKLALASNQA